MKQHLNQEENTVPEKPKPIPSDPLPPLVNHPAGARPLPAQPAGGGPRHAGRQPAGVDVLYGRSGGGRCGWLGGNAARSGKSAG